MKVYSYVVARDYGFAPNPFHGVCTLATCKPMIRKHAVAGDYVVGTGSHRFGLKGHLVYVMRVDEVLSYDDYWSDPRFLNKRPSLHGSLKQAYGDNIYHRGQAGRWVQEDSHHSLAGGRPNVSNIRHDTQASRVLVGYRFTYWGSHGPKIPPPLRKHYGVDVCGQRGHKCNFPAALVAAFLDWIGPFEASGYVGCPKEMRLPSELPAAV